MVAHLQAPETQLPNESSNQPLRFPVLPPISFFCSLLLIEAFKTQQSCSIRSCFSFPFQLHPHNSSCLSSSSTWLTLCLALQVYGNGLSIPNPAAEVVYTRTLISEQLTRRRKANRENLQGKLVRGVFAFLIYRSRRHRSAGDTSMPWHPAGS